MASQNDVLWALWSNFFFLKNMRSGWPLYPSSSLSHAALCQHHYKNVFSPIRTIVILDKIPLRQKAEEAILIAELTDMQQMTLPGRRNSPIQWITEIALVMVTTKSFCLNVCGRISPLCFIFTICSMFLGGKMKKLSILEILTLKK